MGALVEIGQLISGRLICVIASYSWKLSSLNQFLSKFYIPMISYRLFAISFHNFNYKIFDVIILLFYQILAVIKIVSSKTMNLKFWCGNLTLAFQRCLQIFSSNLWMAFAPDNNLWQLYVKEMRDLLVLTHLLTQQSFRGD